MNDFEKEVLSLLKSLDTRMTKIEGDMNEMKGDMNEMKGDIDELKEQAEITRAAVNYNGEKLDELITELKGSNIIA